MSKGRHYVNNAKLYDALVEYNKECTEAEDQGDDPPIIPNYIGECIMLIANNLSRKSNFINYPYREELISDGIENAIMYGVRNYNIEKKNPHAYFTTIIYYAFLRRIDKEKKHLYIKHKVRENTVLTDTFAEKSEHGTDGHDYYGEESTDYMDEFVKNYEEKMDQKKKKTAKKTLFDGD